MAEELAVDAVNLGVTVTNVTLLYGTNLTTMVVRTTAFPTTGFFEVTVTNAAAPNGVRVTDVKHHLKIPPITPNGNTFRAKFHVPATPPARATTDPTDPPLVPGIQVAEMFLFPLDSVLEVGDVDTVSGLLIHSISVGNFEITCHIHGDILVDDLIPNGENNPTARRGVTIS